MKSTTLAILIGVLIAGTYAQTAACPTDSKFLNMIKSKDSSVLLTNILTGSSFKICNEVWSTTGTCCDQDKITTLFDNVMKNDQKSGYDKFMGGLKNVGGALDRISTLYTNKDDAKTKLTTVYGTNQAYFNGMTVDQAVMALGYSVDFKTDLEKFKTEGKDCFEAVKANSGKIFCYGCAGTPPTSLQNSDGSTTITQPSCDAMLGKCFTTWRFMFRVGGMMQAVSILNRAAKSDAPAPKTRPAPGFGGVSLADIVSAFTKCKDAITDSTCDDASKAILCKANFNTKAPPKDANDDNKSADNVAGLPPKPARILQTVTESTGDVGISSTGLDLTKSITTPSSSASVDSTTVSNSSKMIVGGIIAFLSTIVLLN